MKGTLLLALTAGLVFGGCQSKTVVYTSPSSGSRTVYAPARTRTVTNTVYVTQADDRPTAIPGASQRVGDPGDPAKFPAVSQ